MHGTGRLWYFLNNDCFASVLFHITENGDNFVTKNEWVVTLKIKCAWTIPFYYIPLFSHDILRSTSSKVQLVTIEPPTVFIVDDFHTCICILLPYRNIQC